MLLVLPIFLSEVWGLAVFVLWPLAFLAWSHSLLRGSSQFPKRSLVAWALVFLLSAVWYVEGWRLGLQYEGAAFTWGCLGLSLILALSTLSLGLACRKKPSFPKNLAAHWLLFAWVATYAFPYLGETP
jgi:hypothetical protein